MIITILCCYPLRYYFRVPRVVIGSDHIGLHLLQLIFCMHFFQGVRLCPIFPSILVESLNRETKTTVDIDEVIRADIDYHQLVSISLQLQAINNCLHRGLVETVISGLAQTSVE